MKLESGAWLTPSIQLLRLVDEGAMGAVWAADHLSLGTEVAVKFVSDHHAKNRNVRRRLEAEARAAARIKSPHVVQIFDVAETPDEKPFIVMELLDGETLRRRLDRGELLTPTETALVVIQACRALHSAHRLGIVHRDIKPDNLFLLEDEDSLFLKILDFGIAKGLTKGLTEPGVILGTPVYLCRELITERRSDHRGDLWSLAIVAYEALTGHLPFDGETLDEVFASIWRGRFTPASELNHQLTPAVDAWFARALHKNPQERPATAKALAATFVDALATMAEGLIPNGPDDLRISQLSLLAQVPSSSKSFASDPDLRAPSYPPVSSSPRPSDAPPAFEKVRRTSSPTPRSPFDTERSIELPAAPVDAEGARSESEPPSSRTPTPAILATDRPRRSRWLIAAAITAPAAVAIILAARPEPLRLVSTVGAAAQGMSIAPRLTTEPAPPAPAEPSSAPLEVAPTTTATAAKRVVVPPRRPPRKAAPPAQPPLPQPAPPPPPATKPPEKDLGF